MKELPFVFAKLLTDKRKLEAQVSTVSLQVRSEQLKEKLQKDLDIAKEMLAEFTTCEKIAKDNEADAKDKFERKLAAAVDDAAQYVRVRQMGDEEAVCRELREFKEWLAGKLPQGTPIATIYVADLRTRKPSDAFSTRRVLDQRGARVVRRFASSAFCSGWASFCAQTSLGIRIWCCSSRRRSAGLNWFWRLRRCKQ